MEAKPLELGKLRLVPGGNYHVVFHFRDHDGALHEPPEEWTFRGYDFLPYDSGLTLYVAWPDGSEGAMRFRWESEFDAHILDAFDQHISAF